MIVVANLVDNLLEKPEHAAGSASGVTIVHVLLPNNQHLGSAAFVSIQHVGRTQLLLARPLAYTVIFVVDHIALSHKCVAASAGANTQQVLPTRVPNTQQVGSSPVQYTKAVAEEELLSLVDAK